MSAWIYYSWQSDTQIHEALMSSKWMHRRRSFLYLMWKCISFNLLEINGLRFSESLINADSFNNLLDLSHNQRSITQPGNHQFNLYHSNRKLALLLSTVNWIELRHRVFSSEVYRQSRGNSKPPYSSGLQLNLHKLRPIEMEHIRQNLEGFSDKACRDKQERRLERMSKHTNRTLRVQISVQCVG